MVPVMPYIPQFKDHKRTGFMKFDMHDAIVKACGVETPLGELRLETIFETAYTFGWRHGMITPLLVEQVHIVSPAEGVHRHPGLEEGRPGHGSAASEQAVDPSVPRNGPG